MALIFHADDFGIDPEQSRRILATSSLTGGHGLLNSLSVMVGSPHFEECADLLDPFLDTLHVGLHVNVVEGPCVADPQSIPHLVDERGMFKTSFAHLLADSRGPEADAYARELQCEVTAQIERFETRFPRYREHLRIDSHQHFHLIPAEYEAIFRSVDETGSRLEYLRIPAEPFAPFARAGVLPSVKPVNWPKHWLLNALWSRDRLSNTAIEAISGVFCGILFSGHMDAERVAAVSRDYIALANRQHRDVEFLFHPGRVDTAEKCLDPAREGFVEFTTSADRDVEADALQRLAVSSDGLQLVVGEGVS